MKVILLFFKRKKEKIYFYNNSNFLFLLFFNNFYFFSLCFCFMVLIDRLIIWEYNKYIGQTWYDDDIFNLTILLKPSLI